MGDVGAVPPQGHIAGKGYVLVSGESLGQHDSAQGFLKVGTACQS